MLVCVIILCCNYFSEYLVTLRGTYDERFEGAEDLRRRKSERATFENGSQSLSPGFFSAIIRARYQQVHLLFGRYSNSMVVVVSDHSTGRGLLDESHV